MLISQGFCSRFIVASIIIGTVVWLVQAFYLQLGHIEQIVLLSVLIYLPVCLLLTYEQNRNGQVSRLFIGIMALQPVAAICLLSAFLSNSYAIFLSLPWLIFTVLVSIYGLTRMLRKSTLTLSELSINIGFLYVLLGGVWLTLSRISHTICGFSAPIPLLTAVHFHYTGLILPIYLGMCGRLLKPDIKETWLYTVPTSIILISILLLALGITFSHEVEVLSVLLITASSILVSFLLLSQITPHIQSLFIRIMLSISAVSLPISLLFSCLYAYGQLTGKITIGIPEMVAFHGMINAFGFSLAGLVALAYLRPKSDSNPPSIPFSRFFSTGKVGASYFEDVDAIDTDKEKKPLGLVDHFTDYQHKDLDIHRLHSDIRLFYEQTAFYELEVKAKWDPDFIKAARIFKYFSNVIEQLNFPEPGDSSEDEMNSVILPLKDSMDGRTDVRAWVRSYKSTGKAIYAAAYSNHTHAGIPYMNIAFPLPFGNLTSILRLQNYQESGIVLSTIPKDKHHPGDEGVYFANQLLPFRLPFNETIKVWIEDESVSDETRILARHDIWLLGIHFLSLSYFITKKPIL